MSLENNVLLLVEKCSHCFSYYDIASGKLLKSIPLPDYPHEFVVDAAQKYAYVGHYGVETSGHLGAGGTEILQIDIAAQKLLRSINLAPFNRLHGIQIDNQDRLYVLSEEKATLLVLDNPAIDNAPSRAVKSGGIKSHLFALTKDGQSAYCMNLLSHTVSKVKPHDATTLPILCTPGAKPEGYALSFDEQTLFVTCRLSNTLCAIDTQTMQLKYQADSRNDATRLYLYRDGRLVVTNYGAGSLSIVDSANLQELAHIDLGARAIALSFHPTEPLAFVSQDNDRLAYFNMDTLQIERLVVTQKEPDVSRVVSI